MNQPMMMENEGRQPITIIVGGQVFVTSQNSIQSLPGTLLAKLTAHLSSNTNYPSSALDGYQSRFVYITNAAISGNASDQGSFEKPQNYHDSDGTAAAAFSRGSPIPSHVATPGGPPPPTNTSAVIHVDRNPILMPYILDLYRLGQLHLPPDLCSTTIRSELHFWGVSEDLISPCCWSNYNQGLTRQRIIDVIANSLTTPSDGARLRNENSLIHKIWMTMEHTDYSPLAKLWCVIYFLFVLLSVVVFCLSWLPEYRYDHPDLGELFHELQAVHIWYGEPEMSEVRRLSFTTTILSLTVINFIVDIFFTVEFLIRLVISPHKVPFLRSPHSIIDMFIIQITWLNNLLEILFTKRPDLLGEPESVAKVVFSFLIVIRVLRVYHLTKHLSSMKLIFLSLRGAALQLFLWTMLFASAVVVFGTALLFVSKICYGGDNTWLTMAHTMWWAAVTLTTVGYGDVTPTTEAGYFIAVCCSVVGVLLIALLVAILVTSYIQYHGNMTSGGQRIRQRKFLEAQYPNQLPSPFPGTAVPPECVIQK